jgi:hypothetical protein
MRVIEDGIHADISIKEYHENTTHISATQIKYAKTSLKHFAWYISGKIPKPEGSHFGFGNAFELALLDEKGYLKEVAVMPDGEWYDKSLEVNPKLVNVRASGTYQDAKKEWLKAINGKYVINDTGKESFETIESMLESCYQDKVIQALIKNTEYQLSLFWTDEETGLKLKTRPDICKRNKNVIINLKTIEDGSPEAWSRELAKWDYPLQACIEIKGCLATGLMDRVDSYFWLVVEKVPPYNATIYEFTESDQKACADSVGYHLNKLARAKEQNSYPGYSNESDNVHGILKAELPKYYRF